MRTAPILLFVYNRPEHTRRTLESLRANRLAGESRLIIYSDGAKPGDAESVAQVREVCRGESWCGSVEMVERPENLGLAGSIVGGIRAALEQWDRVIVLEDDLVLSPGFLEFMNEALGLYADEERVMHISGYAFPLPGQWPETLFLPTMACWGWATWRRAFQHFTTDADLLWREIEKAGGMTRFDLDGAYSYSRQLRANREGRSKTWAVKWLAAIFLQQGLCLYPGKSLVRNIGNDGSGVNCNENTLFDVAELADRIPVKPIPLVRNEKAWRALRRFFLGPRGTLPGRSIACLRQLLRLPVRLWRKCLPSR